MDIKPQPNYPFVFGCADALSVMEDLLRGVPIVFGEHGAINLDTIDAIHASPPCQHYSSMGQRFPDTQALHPDLLAPTRELLIASGLPYVIENVGGARSSMRDPYQLCGSSFGLGVRRHRLFETSFPMLIPECQHAGGEIPVYGKLDGRRVWTRADGSELRAPRELSEGADAMGIDWMTWDELTQAIPPAYTEHIGHHLAQTITKAAA